MSVNKVILIGNIGQDPELRKMPNGDSVANVSLATSKKWRDKQTGEQKEKTEWHRVVFYGKTADAVAQYCPKGSTIYVEGELETRKWQDNQGVERYTTEIKANVMDIQKTPQGTGGHGQQGGQQGNQSRPAQQPARQQPAQQPRPQQNGGPDYDDDIPF